MKKVKTNQLRIIGGQWRGRKLAFANGEGLRPTMDRVRETLFNWLQSEIVGAHCLDAFSGSGALGFEALSRYAGSVVMIDTNPSAIRMIRENLNVLGATSHAQVLKVDAQAYLRSYTKSIVNTTPERPFDIVFLDPPFNKQLVEPYCQLLDKSGCLAEHATVYIEIEKNAPLPKLPDGWSMVKQKKAGQLAFFLVHNW